MSTVIHLRFNETARPVDAAGSLLDLAGDAGAGLALPVSVQTPFGRGRQFGDDIGLVAGEQVQHATRLRRSCTIRSLLDPALDAVLDGTVCTVVARGVQGSAAERILFGLEIKRTSAELALLRMRWQEQDGTEATTAGQAFYLPPGDMLFVAAIREWKTTGSVTVTYIVNGDVIGQETVAEGDIWEGDDGTTTVGCVGDGLGGYELFMADGAVIDELLVDDDAMTVEEVRQDYQRIVVHQPAGGALLRAYVPPGSAISRDPASKIQRVLASLGDGLGYVIAEAERIREDWWPDRAYGPVLEMWERLMRLPSTGTVAARRTRVLGFLRRILGFARDDIKFALEPLFGLDASDISIVEYSATRIDPFDTDDITTPPSRVWRTYQGNGTVAIAAGECTVSAAAAADLDWRAPGAPAWREASLAAQRNADIDGAVFITKIDVTDPETSVVCGHAWRKPSAAEAFLCGLVYDGAQYDIKAYVVAGGVVGAPTAIAGNVGATVWLRSRFVGAGVFEVSYSLTGDVDDYSAPVQVAGGPSGLRWVGFGLIGLAGATAGTIAVDFDDATIFEPSGTRAFCWQAYRNPALGGTYDLEHAQKQIESQGPAHAHGCAIDDLDGFKLGPTGKGRLGCEPLYPFDPIVS